MRSFGNIAMAGSLIAAVNAVPTTGSSALIKRDDPVCDVEFHDDGSCSNYQCYVEKNAANILGPPMTVSADLNCNGPSCQEIKSDIHTVTQGFTFSVGVESSGEAEDGFKAGVNAGASWNWQMANANTLQETFTLADGNTGHIVFVPYLHQSCGALCVAPADCQSAGPGKLFKRQCTVSENYVVNDPNACGTTPLLVQNGDQQVANGCYQICYVSGPRTGEGCTADPAKCVPPPL